FLCFLINTNTGQANDSLAGLGIAPVTDTPSKAQALRALNAEAANPSLGIGKLIRGLFDFPAITVDPRVPRGKIFPEILAAADVTSATRLHALDLVIKDWCGPEAPQ